jgi:hypothetical protein
VKVEVQILEPNLTMIKPEMSVKANFAEKRSPKDREPRLVIAAKSIQDEGSETYPAAAIEQATPTSPWQPTSAPEIEAFSLYRPPIAAAVKKNRKRPP